MTTITATIRRLGLKSSRVTVTRWCRNGEVSAKPVALEGQPAPVWMIADGQDDALKRLDMRRRGRPKKSACLHGVQK